MQKDECRTRKQEQGTTKKKTHARTEIVREEAQR